MKKLIQGIVKFRRDILPGYRDTFARLALGQSPDVLYIGCSDSRVAVNVFASTDPGDLFVVRNVGNMIPPFEQSAPSPSCDSVAVAIEFALGTLNVSNIIVCGHSECGAMQALSAGREALTAPALKLWLRHGDAAVTLLESGATTSDQGLPRHNQLSQMNVLKQLDHLKTYPIVQERLRDGRLTLHGWWFELNRAEVYAFEEPAGRFIIIDEAEAIRILDRMGSAK